MQRTPSNYNIDVAVGDVSKTGIQHDCPLNLLPNFYVTTHIILDVMHDILEGAGNYGKSAVTAKFLSTGVLPSLDVLNEQILLFPFVEI